MISCSHSFAASAAATDTRGDTRHTNIPNSINADATTTNADDEASRLTAIERTKTTDNGMGVDDETRNDSETNVDDGAGTGAGRQRQQ